MAGILSFPVLAGDLWEVTSTSVSPDGTSDPATQSICFANGMLDPAQVLGGLGNCTFEHKSGTLSAMTFSMTCRTPGMPQDLLAMNVTGDASLNGNNFNMHYVITLKSTQHATEENFKMNGSAQAKKTGTCNAR